VGDEQGRGVEPLAQGAQQFQDLGLDCDVQGGGGLVGYEQDRVTRDGLGDHAALPLPTRELVRIGVERLDRIGHLDQVEQFDRTLLCLRRRDAEV